MCVSFVAVHISLCIKLVLLQELYLYTFSKSFFYPFLNVISYNTSWFKPYQQVLKCMHISILFYIQMFAIRYLRVSLQTV